MYAHRRSLIVSILILAVSFIYADLAVAAEPLQVDVMTFNIRYGTANDGPNHWDKRKQLVFDVISDYKCDVVGLQEAMGFQIEAIIEAVPVYGRIGVAREDGKNKGEYSPILYNKDRFKVDESGTFWFSNTPDVPGSSHWGNVCVRICSWARLVEKATGKAFYMFNLHIDHVSQPSREKSMVLLIEKIRERSHDDPFVVTGDFNAGEGNAVVRYLKAATKVEDPSGKMVGNPLPLVDTFRQLHPDEKTVGTFNGFDGTGTGAKIDYILTLPDIKVLETEIIRDNTDGRYPSDHFPIRARLQLPTG